MEIANNVNNRWETVIGLEIHAQVTSNSKLFSSSPHSFGAEPNSQASYVDLAMPGMLPVLNMMCVEQAIKTALGLNAEINPLSIFERKNYFYPDSPQGYQISQFTHPIVGKGSLKIETNSGDKIINISRIQLEQDAGKSIHDQSPNETFLDFNRCGAPLMEIVTEPDMRNSEEVAEFIKKLRSILRYLGTCDGDMEKGSLRCDANISIKPLNSSVFGTRVEVKNLNSIRNVVRAINFEAQRQISMLEKNLKIDQETRLFDSETGETRLMRSKEDASDYRYFPDPDLNPLVITSDYVSKIRLNLPELPEKKKNRYITELGISQYDAEVIVADKITAEYFEELAKKADPKLASNWLTSELFGYLNKSGLEIDQSPISASQLAELLNLITNKTISGKIAKQVFEIMFNTKEDPIIIIEREGLRQVTDSKEVEVVINAVISDNPEKVAEYRAGKNKLFAFFIGQIMQRTQGKANPELVNQILQDKLKSE